MKPISPYAAAHYDGIKDERERKRGSRVRKTTRPRFAFQTKSADDILDDGFRWRKYGQKAVKNSIYPRCVPNIYICAFLLHAHSYFTCMIETFFF